MVFQRLFKSGLWGTAPERAAAEALYAAAVDQARLPTLYTRHGVPDSFEGRFESLVLHVHLILRRLGADPRGEKPAQALFDTLFHDMDRTLRAAGVGDMSVGKKVKQMGAAFYGRVNAYEPALAAGDHEGLAAALARNVTGEEAPHPVAGRLADYTLRQAAYVDAQLVDELLAGRVGFLSADPADAGR